MRFSLRPLLPRETDWEKLATYTLPAAAAIGVTWLKLGLPLPPCTFKNLTGCPCCGCGATRATHALLSGKIDEAISLNPMIVAGFIAFAAYGIFAVTSVAFTNGRRIRPDGLPRRTGMMIRITLVLLVAANWAWVILHLPESPWRAQ
jgi:hypothetical protein